LTRYISPYVLIQIDSCLDLLIGILFGLIFPFISFSICDGCGGDGGDGYGGDGGDGCGGDGGDGCGGDGDGCDDDQKNQLILYYNYNIILNIIYILYVL
tara:strand:+ start:2388 stop:2684 length:297 start_codon:yes stop_codon:yes gene_type:complete